MLLLNTWKCACGEWRSAHDWHFCYETCGYGGGVPKEKSKSAPPPEKKLAPKLEGTKPDRWLEERVILEPVCCGVKMDKSGHLMLRGVSGPKTKFGFECKKCFRRLQVNDCWDMPGRSTLDAIDDESE